MLDDARAGVAGRTTKPPSFGFEIGSAAGATGAAAPVEPPFDAEASFDVGCGMPRFFARSCELTTVSRPVTGTHDGRRSSDGVRTFGELAGRCTGGGRIVFEES